MMQGVWSLGAAAKGTPLNEAYAYDDIGNRTAAEGKTYAANALNQYTAIDAFVPEYDADGIYAPRSVSDMGNQTLVRTDTGLWQVTYRPVRYRETRSGARYIDALFVYDGYRCVQRLYGVDGRVYQSYVWDPTEPVATRPLKLAVPDWGATLCYAHDGNKNVTALFYHTLANGLAALPPAPPEGPLTHAHFPSNPPRPARIIDTLHL